MRIGKIKGWRLVTLLSVWLECLSGLSISEDFPFANNGRPLLMEVLASLLFSSCESPRFLSCEIFVLFLGGTLCGG